MAGDDFGFHKAVCFGKYQGKNNIVHKRRWTRSVANHMDDSATVFSHFTNSVRYIVLFSKLVKYIVLLFKLGIGHQQV